jgi:hypothetical protein
MYPAVHANGDLRYWDGERWVEPPVEAGGEQPAARPSFFRRKTSRLTATIVAAVLFVAGVGLGGAAAGEGTSGPDAEAPPSLMSASASPTPEVVALDIHEDVVAELASMSEKHDDARARIADLERDARAAKKRADESSADAATRDAELVSAQARIAELEAAAAAPPVQESVAVPEPPAPVESSWSYANCTEARANGAAPVYRGQPGYGSHLDRDNDGIGCE